jgi:hypothetical protein
MPSGNKIESANSIRYVFSNVEVSFSVGLGSLDFLLFFVSFLGGVYSMHDTTEVLRVRR